MGLNNIKINNTTNVKTGVVYDISKATGQSYETLSDALDTDGKNVPSEVREGGMSVRFIHTADDNYLQYRYMGTETTGNPNPFLDTVNWQGVDDEPTNESNNLIESSGVYNADKDLNHGIVSLRDTIGKEELAQYTKYDLVGMFYNGTGIVAANVTYDAIQIKVSKGDIYNSMSDYVNFRFNTEPFVIGGSDGESYYLPFTVPSDGYILITVKKTSMPISVSRSITGIYKELKDVEQEVETLKEKCGYYINQDITVYNGRLHNIINLGNPGKKVHISVNLVSGTDSETWRVYGTNQEGTALDPSIVIVRDTAFGDVKEFIVPSNGFIAVFTTALLSTERIYNVICGLLSSL